MGTEGKWMMRGRRLEDMMLEGVRWWEERSRRNLGWGSNGGVVGSEGGCGRRRVMWRWTGWRSCCKGMAVSRYARVVVQGMAMAEAGRR